MELSNKLEEFILISSWEIKDYDYLAYNNLLNKLDISPVLIKLLTQRGLNTYEEVQDFLYADLSNLSNPYDLKGMSAAVDRIKTAITNQEKVVIYGDYDVDGVCSIVILLECFKKLGLKADYYVPDRFSEGYGLNLEAVKGLASQGFTLAISVDCGITSIDEVQLAKDLGLDFIITDHHTPGDTLPRAIAIINPKLDYNEQAKHLCGAGVAYKLASALSEGILAVEEISSWLDLAALATVADIVPLIGDNRIIVKYGLDRITNTKRPGLKALLSATNLDGKIITTWHIGFIIAPRLNAAGRMESASLSVALLSADDYAEALNIANQLCELNNLRKSVEEQILKEAILYTENHICLKEESILVVAGDNWHQGVIGIVASRLAEKYSRPAIIISWEDDEGRGSGRSVGDFDLYKALHNCAEHLLHFGGHKLAAGLSLKKEQFTSFKSALLSFNQEFITYTPQKIEIIDLEVRLEDINNKLLNELKLLEPFGEGNPLPSFLSRQVEIANHTWVGKNKEHLKCKVLPSNIDAIAFGKTEYAKNPFGLLKYDIIFNLDENEFLGRKTLQLKINSLKPSIIPDRNILDGHKQPEPAIGETILAELQHKRPIVMVYPTWRTLSKHYLTLRQVVNPKLIHLLHGKIYINERELLENHLATGVPGIFLITKAYLDYYLKKSTLPANLKFIIEMWPGLLGEASKLSPFQIKFLYAHRQWRLKKEKVNFLKDKLMIIYSNRQATITQLKEQMENVVVEAGENDYVKRDLLREEFKKLDQGALIIDGAFNIYPNTLDDMEELILADMPLSYYEGQLAINQINNTKDFTIINYFDAADIDSNKQYLRKEYPDVDTVKQAWLYFKASQFKPINADTRELNYKIAKHLNRGVDSFSLLPVLMILADLGLCEVKKKGSIMAINFLPVTNSVIDIFSSPYYLEGIAEKSALEDWEKVLVNN